MRQISEFFERLFFSADENKVLDRLKNNDFDWVELVIQPQHLSSKFKIALISALEANHTLKTLRLCGHGLDDAFIIKLSRALAGKENLSVLDLSKNAIGDEGAQALCHYLVHTPGLVSLNLLENQIGHASAQDFSLVLRENQTLKQINLSGNLIDDDFIFGIAQALQSNEVLKELNLYKNEMTQAGAEALLEVLTYNYSLVSLGSSFSLEALPDMLEQVNDLLERNLSLEAYSEDFPLASRKHVAFNILSQHQDEEHGLDEERDILKGKSEAPNTIVRGRTVSSLLSSEERLNHLCWELRKLTVHQRGLNEKINQISTQHEAICERLSHSESYFEFITTLQDALPDIEFCLHAFEELENRLQVLLEEQDIPALSEFQAISRRQARELREINASPKLKMFYDRFHLRMEALFLGHTARSTDLFASELFKGTIASFAIEKIGEQAMNFLMEDLLAKIPIIGFIPAGVAKANEVIARMKALGTSLHACDILGTWAEKQSLAESIARVVTLFYKDTIENLASEEEWQEYREAKREANQNSPSFFKQSKQKAKNMIDEGKKYLHTLEEAPCLEAANFGIKLITLAFHDRKIRSIEEAGMSFEEQIIMRLQAPSKISDKLKNKLLGRKILTQDLEEVDLLKFYHHPMAREDRAIVANIERIAHSDDSEDSFSMCSQ